MKTPKTLGQVAYESTPDEGGKSNFGEWDQAPDVVRRVHEKMAKAIEREVKKRLRYKELLQERTALRTALQPFATGGAFYMRSGDYDSRTAADEALSLNCNYPSTG